MNLSLITRSEIEPLTLEEAKTYCRVETDFTTDDTVLNRLIKSARDYAETFQSRQLITATWRLKLHCWPCAIELPLPPLQSVTSISYVDPDGATQTLSTDVYSVDTTAEPGVIRLAYGQLWPSVRSQNDPPITITFVAGYGDEAGDVPDATIDAMGIHIDWRYRDRDGTRPMPQAVDSLLLQNCWGNYA